MRPWCFFFLNCCLIRTLRVYRHYGVFPGRRGTAIYGLYRYMPLWRVWFSSCLLWDRVYKSESLGLELRVSFSRKLISSRSCGVDEIFQKDFFFLCNLIWMLNFNIIALSIDLVFHFSLIRHFRWCHSWMRHLTRFWRRWIEFPRQERLLISTGIAK